MFRPLSVVLISLLSLTAARADLRVAPVFSDHLVLQRELPVAVWGWADKGRAVHVEFAGQRRSAKADKNGRWEVRLDPMTASATPRELRIESNGGEIISIKDVLIGEVWLASGQSNMEWPIDQSRAEDKALAASENLPQVRLLQIPRRLSHVRLTSLEARWMPVTPQTTNGFSAVAFFFARNLHKELGVPVGIITSSWGGSRIEPWTPREGFAQIKELEEMHRDRIAKTPGTAQHNQTMRRHLAAVEAWLREARRNIAQGRPAPSLPRDPPTLALGHAREIGLYQAMIHPLVPYTLRGFIWYQGESNNGDGIMYYHKMRALINGWRKVWNRRNAPFLFVQLAPYNYDEDRPERLAEIWGAQLETLKEPHTGMAIINDIGNLRDIHPRNKSEVGRRLALWALADTYDKKDLVCSGPLYAGNEVEGGAVRINFTHLGGGLASRDDKPLSHFEIAGLDGKFVSAEAVLAGDAQSLLVSSPQVPKPRMVRFAWHQAAEPNLINRAGLPASPFHTHWPHDPDLGQNAALRKPYTSSDENPWGWNGGLTDGSWIAEKDHCYATGNSPDFPKHVTVDLEEVLPVRAIKIGVPPFGSTRTVAYSLSTDGKKFDRLGQHRFGLRSGEKKLIRFEPKPARYVRISFLDSYPESVNYDRNFAFATELEAYVK